MALQRAQLVERLAQRGVIMAPAALEALAGEESALEYIDEIAGSCKEFVVSEKTVAGFLEGKGLVNKVVQVEAGEASGFDPPAKHVESMLELSIKDSDVTGKSKCGGNVEDFVRHFRNRFERQRDALRGMRTDSFGTFSIRDAKEQVNKEFRVIAMVYDKKVTKNGHLLIEIEDEGGTANALVPKDSPLMPEALKIIQDEVLALDVYASKSKLLIVKGFKLPGSMLQEKRKRLIADDISIAFISDIHIGSRYFMAENFQRMIRFLNGHGSEQEREIAGKIKYISIAGDLVDGIGVFPNQEKQLLTKNIYTQYEMLGEFLKAIPPHIEVIIAPGNHDGVRLAEPQPSLPAEFTESVKGQANLHFVGNPSRHSIHGLELLIYHGTSIDGLIAHSAALKQGYDRPEIMGAFMLSRRHMCPLYGEDAVVPEEFDYLLIGDTPDIFHFGHIHRNGHIEDYNGTFIVNSGTWQDRTDYQVRMGHNPTPCLLPVYSLKTGKVQVLNFK
ncbi:MAG: metallophosphoesterase [Candidatus Micrarchaeota archaeon]